MRILPYLLLLTLLGCGPADDGKTDLAIAPEEAEIETPDKPLPLTPLATSHQIRFVDVTPPIFRKAGLRRESRYPVVRRPALTWGDWDNDGDLDLPGYMNYKGTFRNRLRHNGIKLQGHYRGAVWADYDGDGDLDFVTLAYNNRIAGEGDRLYRNNGNGTFTDIAAQNGMNLNGHGETAAWADYDGDGDLDLLVPNYQGGFLWRNDGQDRFTNVLPHTGIDLSLLDGKRVRPEGATWFDYDGDGWLDLYVRGALWRNTGDGTFQNVTIMVGGLRHHVHDEGFAPVDIDNDGDFDLSIFYRAQKEWVLFEYDADAKTYARRVSIKVPGGLLGPVWADIDNDGDMDAFLPVYKNYEPGSFWYINEGNWTFAAVQDWLTDKDGKPLRLPITFASFGDYDNDGDLDMVVMENDQSDPTDIVVQPRLLRNTLNTKQNYIRVRVTDENGRLTQHGATVRLTDLTAGTVQTRCVDGGTNWAQSAYDVHFGVQDTRAYELTVSHPNRRIGRHVARAVSTRAAVVPGKLKTRLITVRRP